MNLVAQIQQDMMQEEKAIKRAEKKVKKLHNQEMGLLKKGVAPKRPAPKRPQKPKVKKMVWRPRAPGPRVPRAAVAIEAAPEMPVASNYTIELKNSRETGVGAPRAQTVDLGGGRQHMFSTGHPWTDTVFNGYFADDRDGRFPDPFSLALTGRINTTGCVHLSSHASSSVSSNTSFDWTLNGIIMGGGKNTILYGMGCQTTSPYSYDWKAADGYLGSAGVCSPYFLSRPNAIVTEIIPNLVGPVHNVTLCVCPIPALNSSALTSENVSGWPATVNVGCTLTQIAWGARQFILSSVSKGVRLVSLPYDARAFDFFTSDQSRYSQTDYFATNWSGFLFWAFGMTEADTFDVRLHVAEEIVNTNKGYTGVYPYPVGTTVSDSMSRDRALRIAKSLLSQGLTMFEIESQTALFSKLNSLGYKTQSQKGSSTFQPYSTFTVSPTRNPITAEEVRQAAGQALRAPPAHEKEKPEQKVDDSEWDASLRYEDLSKSTLLQALRTATSATSSSSSQAPASAGPKR